MKLLTARPVFSGFVSILLFSFTLSAQAALHIADWQTNGDGAITYDDETNLEWLDLSVTVGRSFLDVSSKFSFGEEFYSWRHADLSEVHLLLPELGIPITPDLTVYAPGLPGNPYHQIVANAVDYIGTTYPEWQTVAGFDGFVASEDYAKFIAVRVFSNGGVGISTLNTNGISLDYTGYKGHFLVRDKVVPIPAAFWLFSSALLGLIGLKQRP